MRKVVSTLTAIILFCCLAYFSLFRALDNKKAFTYNEADAPLSYAVIGDDWYGEYFPYIEDIYVDSSRNLFVADSYALKKLNMSWQLQKVINRNPVNGEYYPRIPRAIGGDAAGNIYVADTLADRTVAKFDRNGNFVTDWGGFGSGQGQFWFFGKMFVDTAGNSYIVDHDIKRVQKFDTNGNYLMTIGSGGSGDGQFAGYPNGISVDSTGHIFVSEIGTTDRINEFDATGAYVTRFGTTGTGDGQFNEPIAIVHDSSDNLYVLDAGNDRVQKFDSSNVYTSKWGSSGSGADLINDAKDIAIDSLGHLYIADYGDKRVKEFTNAGEFVRASITQGKGNGQFFITSSTADIDFDAAGNVYIPDTRNDRIQIFSSTGTYLSQFGSSGTGDGQFDFPESVAIDRNGNIFVADLYNTRVQKFSASKEFISKWGSSGTGDGQFTELGGAVVTSDGNVYVNDITDTGSRIQIFTNDGAFISAFELRIGSECPDNYCAGVGMAVDASDNIYIADAYSNRIKKFSKAGTYISSFPVDVGDAWPDGIAVDSNGYIYAALPDINKVRKYDQDGNWIATYFGLYGTRLGEFDYITTVAVDTKGDLYIFDSSNSRIQKFVFDKAPPVITISSSQAESTSSSTFTVHATATDALTALTAIQYQLDSTSGAWHTCTPSDGMINELSEEFYCVLGNIADGQHTVYLRSTDSRTNTNTGSGTNGPKNFTFVVNANGTTITPTPMVTDTVTPSVTPTPTENQSSDGSLFDHIKIANPVVTTPVINEFSASQTTANPGDTVTITWDVDNAKTVTIGGIKVVPKGTMKYVVGEDRQVKLVADSGTRVSVAKIDFYNPVSNEIQTAAQVGTGAVVAEIAIQQVVTIVATQFGATPTILTANVWGLILSVVQKRSKRRSWGVVYDSISKEPLGRAIVRLVNTFTEEVVDTVVTDAQGVFQLKAPPAKYMIKVARAGYTFPSGIIRGQTDYGYTNLYFGEIVERKTSNEKDVIVSIPLDPIQSKSRNQMHVLAEGVIDTLSTLSTLVLFAGLGYSIYATVLYPLPVNILISVVYLLVCVAKILIMFYSPKLFGRVTDSDGKPVEGLEVGLFDKEFDTLLYRTFTNKSGEYNFVASNKPYVIKVLDTRYTVANVNGDGKIEVQVSKYKRPDEARLITANLLVRKTLLK